ncbi:hypothetical protein IKX64_02180 [Candidatus Saccharibacteria bacterium]|nr:hypothetical protein [Candidatus Saccharibacteria bacterium]
MAEIFISTIIIAAIGTLAHFLYDLTNHNKFIGIFAAVNESTWEHIKIALTPMLLWGLYDGFVWGENPNYFLAKFASLMVPIVFIPLIFYSYKAIFRKPILIIDILTFYVAIFLGQFVFKTIVTLPEAPYICGYLACAGTFALFGAYAVLTLMPLEMLIFKDPISKKYGYQAHTETFNIFKKKKTK